VAGRTIYLTIALCVLLCGPTRAPASDAWTYRGDVVVRLPPFAPEGVRRLPPVGSALASRMEKSPGAHLAFGLERLPSADRLSNSRPSESWQWWTGSRDDIASDVGHYYSASTMRDLALAFALAAPLANTSLDHDFRDWYHTDVRDRGTDRFATTMKLLGEGKYLIPACGCLALGSMLLDRWQPMELPGAFGRRATRAYLVGGPPMLLMQYTLGASRPGETRFNSQWKPFDDINAVSGHAFVGAVPFITAAQMSDDLFAQALLYGCSVLPAWSRVNDDAHYLSQAFLGWTMAYLACRAVDHTESNLPSTALIPLAGPNFNGLGLLWRR